MNVPLPPCPTEWFIAIRGYPARQWRRRLAVGGKRAVAMALLPGVTQCEVRGAEILFAAKHATITVSRLKDDNVRVALTFKPRGVS